MYIAVVSAAKRRTTARMKVDAQCDATTSIDVMAILRVQQASPGPGWILPVMKRIISIKTTRVESLDGGERVYH